MLKGSLKCQSVAPAGYATKSFDHADSNNLLEDPNRALGFLTDIMQPVYQNDVPSDALRKPIVLDDHSEGLSSDGLILDEALQTTPGLSTNPDLSPSPYMVPNYFQVFEKYRSKKAPPSKNPTPFQKQLSKNPYAQALATPMRVCYLTRTFQPAFFMQDFNLMAHPDTSEPWWVPGSLLSEPPDRSTSDEGIDGEYVSVQDEMGAELGSHPNHDQRNVEKVIDIKQSESDETLPLESAISAEFRLPTDVSPGTVATVRTRIGPRVWLSSRQDVFSAIQDPQSGYGIRPWNSFISSMAQAKTTRAVNANSGWRGDMDKYVLEQMRRQSRGLLEYLCTLKRGYVTSCTSLDEAATRKRQAAVILWTGRYRATTPAGEEETQQRGPHEFAVLDMEQPDHHLARASRLKIPVHNLRVLLGKEHLEYLQDKYHAFQNEYVILKSRRIVVDVMMKLWKLQGYLARYENFYSIGDAQRAVELARERRMLMNPAGYVGDPNAGKDPSQWLPSSRKKFRRRKGEQKKAALLEKSPDFV